MADFNAVNRGVYVADNLEFLRHLNDECIDLACIDPPFSKGDTFEGDQLKPDLSDHEREVELRLLRGWGIHDESDASDAGIAWPATTAAGFKDVWSWEQDIHEDWIKDLAENHAPTSELIETTRLIHDEHIAAYLCYMAVRLIEIHRVLKSTGSLFLHCDHTANGYLRQLLDSVFGKDQMQNEIIWCYAPAGRPPKRGFHRKHDTIFYYRKTNAGSFNHQYGPMSPETLATYSETDEEGRKYKIAQGGRRTYLDQQRGRPIPSWWDDIPSFGTATNAPERTGYRTQKPIALAERIISASTNKGDVVLDCFAGCASSAIAAERLDRRWVACDLNPRAWTVFKRQFSKPKLALLRCSDEISGQAVWGDEPVVTVHGPNDLPVRTSQVQEQQPKRRESSGRKFKVASNIISEEETIKITYGIFWPEGQSKETHAVHGRLEIDPDDRTTLDLFTYTTGKGDPKQWIVDPDAAGEQLRILGETTIGRKWLFISARRVGGYMDHLDGLPSPEPRVIGSIYASEHAVTWWALRDTLPDDVHGVELRVDGINAFLVPFTSLQQVTSEDDSIQLKVDKSPKFSATPVPGCEIVVEHDHGLPIEHRPDGSIALERDPVVRIRFLDPVQWEQVEMILTGLLAFFRIVLWHPVRFHTILTVDRQEDGTISFIDLIWPGPRHYIPDPIELPSDAAQTSVNYYRALIRQVDLTNGFNEALRRWFNCYQDARAAIELLLLGAFRPDNRPEDTVLYLIRSLERVSEDRPLSTKNKLEGKLADVTKRYARAFKNKEARVRLVKTAVATRDWYTHRNLSAEQSRAQFIARHDDELENLNRDLLILLKMIFIEEITADQNIAIHVAQQHTLH